MEYECDIAIWQKNKISNSSDTGKNSKWAD